LVNKTPTPAIPELDPASDGEWKCFEALTIK
jgi:hypothetical protein